MRVHVALTPVDLDASELEGQVAIVVDVLRATTTVVAACAAGCLRVIPVADPAAALAAAAAFPPGEVLLAGERGGDPVAGFDLGNSPLEYTGDRVAGRTIILTTTNGTATMKSAAFARAAAAAALVNLGAVVGWTLGRACDVTVLCSGDVGALSLEDTVCAGLFIERMEARAPGLELSEAAVLAVRLAEYYGARFSEMRLHSRWARRLAGQGRSADIDACFCLDTAAIVPVFEAGAIVPDSRAVGAAPVDATGVVGREATG
jgi:2-phosphosulfolactate phosphatase